MAIHCHKRLRSPSPLPSLFSKRYKTVSPSVFEEVKFFIISDTHDAELSKFPECDVVLHCGDLTEDGSPESICSALQMLGNVKAELKLAIAGNHEISLDKDYYLSEGGSEATHERARSLVYGPNSEAAKQGVTFLDEGMHEFTLKSGATFRIYASPWTPKHGASAFQYPTSEDRYNEGILTSQWAKNVGTETSRIPDNVDSVMTHGPPQYVLDTTEDGHSAGCSHLRRAISRVQPRLHCFGHIHCGYGAQRLNFHAVPSPKMKDPNDDSADAIIRLAKEWFGVNQAKKKGYGVLRPISGDTFKKRKQTMMVNAAVMDSEDEPGNPPFLVYLDLPVPKASQGTEC
ncbi:Metallo-dependent phosphatase-like protein [Massariosphaeria phaeospora]|uniref:Metallo-dependent phosphatase-like protein n=1 Tax=Massariosphaeria phaeospora TaxID=100035 RepID=A0A7C8IP13_9PLEO|nr:Metallo-dependent phosphatase-like protein [Massariosphaeria phaeospora]